MNIIVTGTSQGIGRELVKEFCRKIKSGKIYCATRSFKKFLVLEKECASINKKIFLFPLVDAEGVNFSDVENNKQIPANEKIDIIINNAATLINRPFAKISEGELYETYRINVFHPFRTIQVILPHLKKGSHIVNISSMGGVQGTQKFAGLSAYSSSKGALAVLTECLAEELKPKGIAVNCLALGAVQTEMLSKAFPKYKAPVTAKQMAEFICEFALTGNKYFNGKIIPVSLSTP